MFEKKSIINQKLIQNSKLADQTPKFGIEALIATLDSGKEISKAIKKCFDE